MTEEKPQHRRAYPAHGVHAPRQGPLILFITVCTKGREPWLANEERHRCILDAWNAADTWAVGRYVVMPDHIHLFAAPVCPDTDIGRWIQFWKSQVSRAIRDPKCRWQKDYWDTRLRSGQSYGEKWQYIRDNPVRHKLAVNADDWPYQGEITDLPWLWD